MTETLASSAVGLGFAARGVAGSAATLRARRTHDALLPRFGA